MAMSIAVASIVGCVAYLAIWIGETYAEIAVATFVLGKDPDWQTEQVLNFVPFYLFFGVPLAIVLGLAVGLPVWKHAESRPLRSGRHAALLGALTGTIIGSLFLLLSLANGLNTYFDDGLSYDSWHWGYQVTKDGMPTPLGWFYQLLNVLYFAVAGILGGLAARWAAVPKRFRN